MKSIGFDSSFEKSLVATIKRSVQAESRHAAGRLGRIVIYLNRQLFVVTMQHFQGLDFTFPAQSDDEAPKSFGEKWARYRKLKSVSLFHRFVVVSMLYTAMASIFTIYAQYIYNYNCTIMRLVGAKQNGISTNHHHHDRLM
jgi:hypothetical protein